MIANSSIISETRGRKQTFLVSHHASLHHACIVLYYYSRVHHECLISVSTYLSATAEMAMEEEILHTCGTIIIRILKGL